MLSFAACYAAMARRDPAIDGLFFVAVRTTKIYCRPVCRARIPLAKNICLYPSAAAAECAGYRPCLRCRPETAPFSAPWKGSKTTVERALRLIDGGALDQGGVEALAARLGVGPRHLSRLFAQHLEASPTEVAQTVRLQRAKRLLDAGELPIAAIAAEAGFPSARRMSAAFTALYGRPPSALRGKKKGGSHVRD